jgi:hypothetical protein
MPKRHARRRSDFGESEGCLVWALWIVGFCVERPSLLGFRARLQQAQARESSQQVLPWVGETMRPVFAKVQKRLRGEYEHSRQRNVIGRQQRSRFACRNSQAASKAGTKGKFRWQDCPLQKAKFLAERRMSLFWMQHGRTRMSMS